mmetsp:Transcript_48228/g.142603  ORF Transcript_48228/g.142603 Transcript_48228/m.142603 type:complete len:244 (-) Transcript_48228:1234-1965(-)
MPTTACASRMATTASTKTMKYTIIMSETCRCSSRTALTGSRWMRVARDMALFARLLNESGRQVMLENCHWGMCWDTEDGRGISGWGWGVAGEHDWREGNSGCPERLPDGNVTCPCKRAAVRTHALSIIAGAGRGLAFRITCSQFTSFERVETSTRASSTGCATSRAQSDFSIGMRRWPGEDVGPTQTCSRWAICPIGWALVGSRRTSVPGASCRHRSSWDSTFETMSWSPSSGPSWQTRKRSQ